MSTKESWEDELHVLLRKTFIKTRARPICATDYSKLTDYVRSLLAHRKESLREAVEGMKRTDGLRDSQYREIYNTALDAVLELLQ